MGEQLAPTKAVKRLTPAHIPKYARLTRSDLEILRSMHKAGKTQLEIAQALGCTQPTVSKWIASLTDSTDIAKEYLRGSALRMAENIVKKGRASDHVAALKGLSVLEEERSAGLVVQIGVKASDVSITLAQAPFASQVSTDSSVIHSLSDAGGSDNKRLC
jgi:DNA-binding Lrp family transcriptional regulator